MQDTGGAAVRLRASRNAYRLGLTKQCYCGKTFGPKSEARGNPSEWAKRQFCGHSCRNRYIMAAKSAEATARARLDVPKTCANPLCGKQFGPSPNVMKHPHLWPKVKFCEPSCSNRFNMVVKSVEAIARARLDVPKTCANPSCRKQFGPSPAVMKKPCKWAKARFCSLSCSHWDTHKDPFQREKESEMSNEFTEVGDGPPNGCRQVLTTAESARLVELEQRVERGLDAAGDAGEALENIRVTGLYRGTHSTWTAYLSERWSLSHTAATVYIHTWQTRRHLASVLPEAPPPSPTVVRELYPLAIRDHTAVAPLYAEAVAAAGGTAPTAKAVREAVERKLGKPSRRTDEEIVNAWASGEPGTAPPIVAITFTTEEVTQLGKSAKRNGVRLHEEARRLINKALAFEAG